MLCLREHKLNRCASVCLQAIKESATELLFGGHETTASTATSLIMFLGLNPEVVHKLRQELKDKVIHVAVTDPFRCQSFEISCLASC